MTRWWRWTVALLLCGVGAVLVPAQTAAATPVTTAPPVTAGLGHILANLGTATEDGEPGFSFDGAYYGYLVPAGDLCDLHVYHLAERSAVELQHARVECDGSLVHWAAATDTLQWQTVVAAGAITAYVWDAGSQPSGVQSQETGSDPGHVSVLAPDAQVTSTSGISADGRYLAFTGRSASHPAPGVDAPGYAEYVYDRVAGLSLPLSKPDVHVEFRAWSPKGSHFIAAAGGHDPNDIKSGSCFGSGTSCHVVPDLYVDSNVEWSRDGAAVVGSPGSTGGTTIYDFTDGSLTLANDRVGFVDFAHFIGADSRRMLLQISFGQAVIWDRTTDKTTLVYAHDVAYPSPPGKYLLFRASAPDAWRYLGLTGLHEAVSTFRGTDGYWTEDGSAFLGLGPASRPNSQGCSTMLQWSPTTNTATVYGTPGRATCYRLPDYFRPEALSSASGRFALFDKYGTGSSRVREYVVDLRRHVLRGPLQGEVEGFAPGGSDVLVVRQPLGSGTARLFLVDTSVSVDDKPRWSSKTPLTGTPIEASAGGQVHVQLGASEPRHTQVDLVFRWRTAAGVPLASDPEGWSCDQTRLAGGAVEADCTFAPTAPADVRFLDVSATNVATSAQSDTRSYRVAVTAATPARR